jgi:rhodanese-related sulfurtransferase
MNLISPHDLNSLLASHPSLDIVDVRTPGEFASIHVPSSRLVPLDRLDPAALIQEHAHRDPSGPVYLLCHAGTRARKAAERLAAAGFANTVVIDGGIQAWKAAGLPVEISASHAIPLERQMRIAAGAMILTGVLLARFVNPAWMWLPGFVGFGLTFSGITGACPMLMLIARMPWNRVPEAARSTACGCAR